MRTCQHATCQVPRARVIRRYGGYAAMHFAVMLLCRYAPMPLCSYAREVLRGPLFRHLPSFPRSLIPSPISFPISDIYRHSLSSLPPVRSAHASHLAVFSPHTNPRITSRLPSAPSRHLSSLIAHSSYPTHSYRRYRRSPQSESFGKYQPGRIIDDH